MASEMSYLKTSGKLQPFNANVLAQRIHVFNEEHHMRHDYSIMRYYLLKVAKENLLGAFSSYGSYSPTTKATLFDAKLASQSSRMSMQNIKD